MTTLITNGTVISPSGAVDMDVLIDGEQIVALVQPGSSALGSDLASTAERVIDARGKYVIPGGVDAHTHMELPFGGTFASDTFETGTRAAAWGGTTTIIDFAVQRAGERVFDGLEAWHGKADGNCAIDYGFHMIVGGVDDDSLAAMDKLVNEEGITSVKLFMAYPGVFLSDDAQILKAMQKASSNGSMIMMHAENGPAIDVLIAAGARPRQRRSDLPRHHSPGRARGGSDASGHQARRSRGRTRLHRAHVGARGGRAGSRRARPRRERVRRDLPAVPLPEPRRSPRRAGFEGAKYVCSTPLRSKHEHHQADLWRFLRQNDLQVVSTDHCPFCFKEQKELGIGDFSKIPNGIGGVEHRMDLLYQGVVDGEITIERWVDVAATTPARMFGLYPRKGIIAPGADADVVIYDPRATTLLSVETHHMNMDHSAYEGTVIQGKVDTVLSRGEVIIEDGQYLGKPGHGQYLRRGLSSFLR